MSTDRGRQIVDVAYYSDVGRPSIDPEPMMRMLIVGYSFGIRSERRLCEEVHLNLAYRWFCRLGLDGDVPDHSTFSKNRHGRFRESDLLRRTKRNSSGICSGAISKPGAWYNSSNLSTPEKDPASDSHGRVRAVDRRQLSDLVAVSSTLGSTAHCNSERP